jgi:cytoskeletal protein RodZ|tara:strand:- start:507 stop:809 length:303 start_codon:yes stop_codon:yes gene_type:complete
MGYMGFGMKKETYARKPRKIFKHLKNIYGDKLDKFDHHQKQTELHSQEFSDEDRRALQVKLKQKSKAESRHKLRLLLLSVVLMILGLAGFVWLFRLYFSW